MKCEKCGTEYISNVCPVCGNITSENDIKKLKREIKFLMIMDKFLYYIDRIFFPPAKILFVLWTISWILSILNGSNTNTLFQNIIILLFGYIIFCGIADFIYSRNGIRYQRYLTKIRSRSYNRLEKIGSKYFPEEYRKSREQSSIKRINYDLMDGHDFEYFCADILKKNGFINVEVTRGSGDHGIDVIAEKDGISYAIQCKCYTDNVGNSAVQQAHSGKTIYNKDIAVVMTNRYFTQQAIEEANKLGVKLWDRNKIETLIQNIS